MKEHLEKLFAQHGTPTLTRADNGREFITTTLLDWLGEQQVHAEFIAKASPQQNSITERFNQTMDRELFEHELYHSVLEVRTVVNLWLDRYNTRPPHRSLAGKTPAGYAKMLSTHSVRYPGGGSR